jgi:uncharacterized protein (TIGR03435 family)
MLYRSLIALCVASLLAQAQAPPAFEAASIKPTQHGRDGQGWSHSSIDVPNPGRFVAENSSLDELIRYAYDLKEYQISGPSWLNDDSVCYDITATTPGASEAQIRVMLQTLLADRFHLEAHREKRTRPVYNLVAVKSGAKLQLTTSHREGPSVQSNGGQNGGTFKATNVSMADFAYQLSRHLKEPVFDHTGLMDRYDFSLQYDEAGLLTVVQQQLGLRVESVKAPVDVLIIDRINRVPTGN